MLSRAFAVLRELYRSEYKFLLILRRRGLIRRYFGQQRANNSVMRTNKNAFKNHCNFKACIRELLKNF